MSLVSEFAGYPGSTHVSLRIQFGTQLYDHVRGETKVKESSRTPSQIKSLILHISASDLPSPQTILFRNQWNRLYDYVILSVGKITDLATQLL